MKRVFFTLLTLFLAIATGTAQTPKKIVLVAGRPSHGPGYHEFRAGSLLLKKGLEQIPGVTAIVVTNGWPEDVSVFDDASAVLLFMDGGPRHPAIQPERLALIGKLVEKGVGLGAAHYGVEVPQGDPGKAWQDWIGGYYETHYSCNPIWTAEFKSFIEHPITRGVKPFKIEDEWYFNMRFRPNMEGIIPILVANPSDEVRKGPYVNPRGPYAHIVENSGRDEILMWAVERPDGGRGFGFTGGHRHTNWGEENFRKVVLNALLWAAKVEVPANGAELALTPEDLAADLDDKRRR